MNLLDILNQIYDTKIELKGLLDENNNIARYPVTIHNVIAAKYNEGYADGYHEKNTELIGLDKWPDAPREFLDYDSNDSSEYDPFTIDGLVDIMSDVLGYRLNMKTELDTASDYFPSYPDILRTILDTVYTESYNDGESEAEEESVEQEDVQEPTFSFSNNQFAITSSQAGARCFYIIGSPSGTATKYESPVTISETVTVYYYAKIGNLKSVTNSYTCTYSEQGGSVQPTDPSFTVKQPEIQVNTKNVVTIIKQNAGDTVYYKINDGEYNIYTSPFSISATCTVTAYAVRGNVVSKQTSKVCTYTQPSSGSGEDQPVTPTCCYPTFDQEVNYIILECSTPGATIWYKIGSEGSYTQYTGGFTITQEQSGKDMYCYAMKEGYYDSSVKVYTLFTYSIVYPPEIPQMYMVDPTTSCNLHIWTASTDATIYWRMGNVGPWNHVEHNHANIYPTNDGTVYAYAENQYELKSDVAVFEYNWYSQIYSLPVPEMTIMNNRVYISVPEGQDYTAIYFTTDGSDPKGGSVYSTSYNRSNIVINDNNTVVKARVMLIDENRVQKWSEIASQVFSPNYSEEQYDYTFEYFTVEGATAVYLDGVTNSSNYIMSWSYDKTNWNTFQTSVTGLDPTKKVYLKIYQSNSYRQWNMMSFGQNDRVTISGSIVSLIWADSYTEHTSVEYEQVFKGCFDGCQQLVDASNLIIPITNSLGSDFTAMFRNCVNLVSAPQTPVPVKVLAKNAFAQMFKGCTSLKNGLKFNLTEIGEGACKEMYSGCTNLVSTGNFNLEYIGKSALEEAFKDCTSLQFITLNIISDLTEKCLKNCFNGCTALDTSVSMGGMVKINGIDIKSANVDSESCYRAFYNCSSLTGFGNLPATKVKGSCYYEMFKGCTSLESFGTIGAVEADPNTRYSMYAMFEGCTSLTSAPTLSIHNLDSLQGIYERMFYNCSNLNYIKALFLTDPMLQYPNQDAVYWPYTREWCYGVAENGTFEQDDDAAWYRTGVSAIPVTWVQTENSNRVGEIVSIVCDYDRVTITASNDNAIYYKINDDSDDEGTNSNWTLYTGPFTIQKSCIVYAKCLSNRGIWGNIKSQECIVNVPKLVFTQSGNTITIAPVTGYQYSEIYYKIKYGTQWPDEWTTYDGPFSISASCDIQAKGLKLNGEYGPVSSTHCDFSLGLVDISCDNNVVTLRSDAVDSFKESGSWDTIKIQYKIDSGEWTDYDPDVKFVISSTCDVTARVAYYNVVWEYGDENTVTCIYSATGQSHVLPIPVFKRKFDNNSSSVSQGNPNIIIATYEIPVAQMQARGIKIIYRQNGGAWGEWVLLGSSTETQTIISTNTTFETYAVDSDNVESAHRSYSFEYNPDYQSITVPDPVITIVRESGYDYAYVTCSDSRANCFIHADNTVNLSGWRYLQNGQGVSLYHYANPKTFTIQAYAVIDSYQSNIVSKEYTYTAPGETPTEDEIVPPVIRCDNNLVSISSVQHAEIYYSLDDITYYLYTGAFNITSSRNVYAYCEITNRQSNKTITWCQYNDLNPITTPVVSCVDNYITMTNSTRNSMIYYRLNGTGEFVQYVSPISISADTIVEAYTLYNGQTSNTVTVQCVYVDPASDDWFTISCTRAGKVSVGIYKWWSGNNDRIDVVYNLNGTDGIRQAVNINTVFNLNVGDVLKIKIYTYDYSATGLGGDQYLKIGPVLGYNTDAGYIDLFDVAERAEYICGGKIEALKTDGALNTRWTLEDCFEYGEKNIVSYTNVDLAGHTADYYGFGTYIPIVIPNDPVIEFNNVTNLFTIVNVQSGVTSYYYIGDGSYVDYNDYTAYTIPVLLTASTRVWAYTKYVYGSETLYSNKVSVYCEVITPRVLAPTVSYITDKDGYNLMEVTVHDNNSNGRYDNIEFEFNNGSSWIEFYEYVVSINNTQLRYRLLNSEINNKYPGAMIQMIYDGSYTSWPQIGGTSTEGNMYNMIDRSGNTGNADLLFRYDPSSGSIIKARARIYAPSDPEADENGYVYSNWTSVTTE